MAADLVALLNRMLADPEYVTLARALFPDGAAAGEIAAAVQSVAESALGASVAACLYAEMSVGAVFGLELSDGRRVALKVHQQRAAHEEVRAVTEVQRFLHDRAFPCPGVLRDPYLDGIRTATFEQWCAPGEEYDAFDPRIRTAMARLLARQVADAVQCPSCARLRVDRLPSGLWPTPHNELFDFERTSSGAEWIDERARAARAILARAMGVMAPGHMDWSVKHFRFLPDATVAVVYDWDSLRLAPETRVVGTAAATHTLRFDPTPTRTPEPEEARAFVLAYEEARTARFTADEWKAVSAAALYATAYGARCEHALRGSGVEGVYRSRLRQLRGNGYFPV